MNVIAFASRKGGSGKSTLAAHLSVLANKPSTPALLIDTDPQGSLSHWYTVRAEETPYLVQCGGRAVSTTIKEAKRDGVQWVFIDTPPNMSAVVGDAVRASSLVVIPARPTVFDVEAVKETIGLVREERKPYALVINGAPPIRDGVESPVVVNARAALEETKAPIWRGQITNRGMLAFSLLGGEAAKEYDSDSRGAAEIGRLWDFLQRSVRAINEGR